MFHPAPKPDPRRKKVPRPIRANAERKYDTFSRCYESEDRVEWVGHLPCVVSGCPSKHQDNAHITIDGARRKADADQIVPLCRPHHLTGKDSLHAVGREQFEGTHGVDLAAIALDTERCWRRRAGHTSTPESR